AALDRKLEAEDEAVAAWLDLAACRNPFQDRAWVELAKHYEHRGKDPRRALEATRAAMALDRGNGSGLELREARLLRRIERVATKAARKKKPAAGRRKKDKIRSS